MNQRMHNLNKWSFLEQGKALYYENPRRRTVILEVNCPDETCFYVLQEPEDLDENPERLVDKEAGRLPKDEVRPSEAKTGGEPPNVSSRDKAVTFLAVVKGRDRLEFAVDGAFELMCEGANCYVYTADSIDVSTKIVAPLIYTRIANRRERNPHLELIQYEARRNMEMMQQRMLDEVERRVTAATQGLERYIENRKQGKALGRAGERKSGEADRTGETVRRDRSSDASSVENAKDERKGKASGKRVKVGAPPLDDDYGED